MATVYHSPRAEFELVNSAFNSFDSESYLFDSFYSKFTVTRRTPLPTSEVLNYEY